MERKEISPSSSQLPTKRSERKKSRRPGLLLATVATVLILALVFGLGLGLGLKRKHHGEGLTSGSGTATAGDSLASIAVQPWRRNTEDYALDFDSWDLHAGPQDRNYNFTVSEVTLAPDGVSRTILAVNGQYPGPLIRANRGDRILVNLTNHLPNATTLHWHGMFQNGTNWMDGTTGVTQCPVPPGRSFLYNFTIDQQFGTYWWHAHASTQYIDGIAGPLIVHAPEEAATRQNYDFDRVIVVSDFYHQLSSTLLPGYFSSGNENAEPVPDNGFIQGQNYFNCSSYGSDSGYDCTQNSSRSVFSFEDNKRYRLRFINTGAFTTFQVSIDNHSLEIIEADGTLVEPLPIHRFEIATAQRYSVILATNQSKSTNYWIRAQMNTDCFAADNPVLDTTVLALLTYENTTAAPTQSNDWADALDLVCKDLNNTLLSPTTVQQAPPADVIYETQFAFNIGAYALSLGYMNGTSWKPNEANPTLNQAISGLKTTNASSFAAAGVVSSVFSQNQFIISIPTAKVVDLVIMNFDDGSHPFHLHGHVFWVMATSAEQYFPWDTDLYSQMNSTASNIYTKNPMRRDTFTIGAYSWALIRFENTVPGMWALHCHNIWHMEAGLMMQFLSLESVVKTWVLPDDVAGLCKA